MIGGERAAKTDGTAGFGLSVEVDEAAEFRPLASGSSVDLREAPIELGQIAVHESLAEVGLGLEVVVDTGGTNADGLREILVAEGVVATALDEDLSGVEELGRGVGLGGHVLILPTYH